MFNEGSGVRQLGAAIRKLGFNEFDRFGLATVTSIAPTLVKVDGMSFELDANDLVIAEHLADHVQTVTIGGGLETQMTVKSPLKPGDRVIVASMEGGQFYVIIDKAVMI